MICREAQELIHGYVDGELDLVHNLEIESHLRECAACAGARDRIQRVRSAVAESAPYFRPPTGFESRLKSQLRAATRTGPPRLLGPWQWAGIAAAVLIAALSVTVITSRRPSDELAAQVAASHVRSLMASHLTDVLSSDRHTVKPWFNGKLDFSPPVGDFPESRPRAHRRPARLSCEPPRRRSRLPAA